MKLSEQLRAFESELGLRDGFIDALKHEDDWSLVVKSHALVEAALAQLLAHQLGYPEELLDFFSDLQVGGKAGKLAAVRSLNVLDPRTCRFIEVLTGIRNRLVHRISNVDFNLVAYVQAFSGERLEQEHRALDLAFLDDDPNALIDLGLSSEADPITVRQLFLSWPKGVLIASLRMVLFEIYGKLLGARATIQSRTLNSAALREELMKRLRELGRGAPEG